MKLITTLTMLSTTLWKVSNHHPPWREPLRQLCSYSGSPSGECETYYHLTRLPVEQLNAEPELLPRPELCESLTSVYEVIKDRDLNLCRLYPLYNVLNSQSLKCNVNEGAACGNSVSHADTVRIIGCRSHQGDLIVQRVKSTDKLVVKPLGYETEASEAMTVQHLHLVSFKPVDKPFLEISNDTESYYTLTYSYDKMYKSLGPMMAKPDLRTVISPLVIDVDEKVVFSEATRLLMEIVGDLELQEYYEDPASKFVIDKVSMLRRALGSMSYVPLMTFVNKYMDGDRWSNSK